MTKMRIEGGPAKPVVVIGGSGVGEAVLTENQTVPIVVTAEMTGIITVTTAGTEVQGPDVAQSGEGFHVVPQVDNVGTVWVMPHGADKSTGFSLPSGGTILNISNLNEMDFDADQDGDQICYVKL